MDRYRIEAAIDTLKPAEDYGIFTDDFTDGIRDLIILGREVMDQDSKEDDIQNIKDALSELRDSVEETQGSLSETDDKLGDIYSKLDDVDCYISELES